MFSTAKFDREENVQSQALEPVSENLSETRGFWFEESWLPYSINKVCLKLVIIWVFWFHFFILKIFEYDTLWRPELDEQSTY